jgi:ergothioneine biosynthesis protein EgtB
MFITEAGSLEMGKGIMMDTKVDTIQDRELLRSEFRKVRSFTEKLCEPLETDDYQIQSIPQTSPPKWHLAHVSWFFETFVLSEFDTGFKPWREDFDFIFNSYYYTRGVMHPRPERGLLSRPTVEEVFEYRQFVDGKVLELIDKIPESSWNDLVFRTSLGLHHEQQHQELLLMDVKHNFFSNPLKPSYRQDLSIPVGTMRPVNWIEIKGGTYKAGHTGNGFCFDNETPLHDVLLRSFKLADRFITNGEFLEFMNDGGYSNPALWLADGWTVIRHEGWQHPLYWEKRDNMWRQFTLGGTRDLELNEPVCHLSFYEADAYARWSGNRLPLETELEVMLSPISITGNFIEDDLLHPAPAEEEGQWFGDLWAWTASPYTPYPGFRPLDGSLGEYNGKFMSSQMVLRGGSCVTSARHVRPSYRNFFYPNERWAFTGLRLANDA